MALTDEQLGEIGLTDKGITYVRDQGWDDERIVRYVRCAQKSLSLRHTSEHDKAASKERAQPDHPGQIERREHWRKADRDDRGPETRLLPVEERDGTHLAVSFGRVTPQPDDPDGRGYAGSPVEDKDFLGYRPGDPRRWDDEKEAWFRASRERKPNTDGTTAEGDPATFVPEDGLLPFYDAEGRQRGHVHPDYADKLEPPFTTAQGEPVTEEAA